MSITLADGYEVYLDSICECTYCPPNTKQCAHIDGHWVRLTVGIDCTNKDGVPAVARNFCIPGEVWHHVSIYALFYFPPTTLADAEAEFHRLNAEMRKIAREEPA